MSITLEEKNNIYAHIVTNDYLHCDLEFYPICKAAVLIPELRILSVTALINIYTQKILGLSAHDIAIRGFYNEALEDFVSRCMTKELIDNRNIDEVCMFGVEVDEWGLDRSF